MTPNSVDKNRKSDFISIAQRSFYAILPAYLFVSFVLGCAVIIWQWKGIPIGNLTRDPSNILSSPFYLGAISSLGIMLWTATASICIFTGFICQRSGKNLELSHFLLASGLLTTVLMFDDLFLFHEIVFPHRLHVPEYVVYGVYILAPLSLLACYWRLILRTEFPLFVAAGCFLGASMLADTLTNVSADTSIKFLIEDGLKLFGIMSWFIYYVRLCLAELSASIGGD